MQFICHMTTPSGMKQKSQWNYIFVLQQMVVLNGRVYLLFFTGSTLPNGTISSSKSKFDDKIESSSAKMYFHYYGQLLHQQNMMQDYVRTGHYTILCFSRLVLACIIV